jgi:SAM-dependent methyltransferase
LHFTLIRRWVFEKLLEPQGARFTFWFEYSRDNGEDVTFSTNARRVGARMGMTTRLKVGHVSDMVTGWDSMVDYYDRKFAYAEGEPPASMERIAKYFAAQRALAELVAEYTGETSESAYAKACSSIMPVHDQWQVKNPTTPDEVRAFYGETPEYLYSLVKWNSTPGYQRILNALREARGEKIFEFGGGLGTSTEFLATNGNRVDYYDLPGILRDFAAWRFKRLEPFWDRQTKAGAPPYRPIRIIERLEMANGNGAGYDRVVAIDVLGHLHPSEFDTTCDQLVGLLKPGGILFAHNNWEKPDEPYPSHFDHAARWEKFVKRNGLTQVDDLTWRKT